MKYQGLSNILRLNRQILLRKIPSTNGWTHPYFLQPIRFHAFIIFSSFIFSQFSSGTFSSFTSSPPTFTSFFTTYKKPLAMAECFHEQPTTANIHFISFFLFQNPTHPSNTNWRKNKSKKGKRIQSSSSTMRFLNFLWRKLRLWDW